MKSFILNSTGRGRLVPDGEHLARLRVVFEPCGGDSGPALVEFREALSPKS